MQEDEFVEIIEKVADGLATEREMSVYNSYFNKRQVVHPAWDKVEQGEKEEILSELNARLYQQVHGGVAARRIALWPRISIAASILLIFAAGLFFLRQQYAAHQNELYANDASPGRMAATLILANGEKISLSERPVGLLMQDSKVMISKDKDGQLTYKARELSGNRPTDEWNTLTTAKGETYRVNLPDGSKVWLNAASSLRYLSSLNGQKIRKVVLEGEAFFEISKDKMHPFVVKTRDQEVEVLGTEFNVSSYNDDREVRTTLLEGLVEINHKVVLKPNEQSIVNSNGIKVRRVNAEDFADWKDGLFSFDQEELQSVLKKIARWYNVDVVYEGDFNYKSTFSGSIPKNKKLSEVLKVLTDNENIHFTIKGKKLLVKR